MMKLPRFTASRLAMSYIALSALVLALFAIPLWYAWRVNISTFREYVSGEEMQEMIEVYARDGVQGLTAAVDSRAAALGPDEIIILSNDKRQRVAGNLRDWPQGVPDVPGTYGVVVDRGGSSMRVVASHARLDGGYHLLMGRESARFQSLTDFFWYGIAGTAAIVLVLGVLIGRMGRRAILAEQALHRAHDDLEDVVAQRTAQLAEANESLRRSEQSLAADIVERTAAEALLEGENRILEMIAKSGPLRATLEMLCRLMENIFHGCAASITLIDYDGRLRHAAAPTLPHSFTVEFDGLSMGPDAGPCGVAAYRREQVIVHDIEAYPCANHYRRVAAAHGLRACWSTPVFSSDGHVNGTFAVFYAEPCSPGRREMKTIEQLTHLASIAIERSHAEAALLLSERQRRQAQRLEAMGTLAGGIAHDFNNILGAILGYGEMALRDAPKESRLRRDIGSIVSAGERGRALVDRILAFSRSGVGEHVAVHVEAVVREALGLICAKLPRGVRIETRLDAGRAAMLGDATQVHQVLMNLATNAVQALGAGGVLRVSLHTTRYEARRIATIGSIEAGDYVVLEVADTGSGIAPDVLDRIFDPFFTTKEVGVGTGLGLSLVHGIVTELGGSIDVTSTPGAGSVFTVYFPRAGHAAEADIDAAPDVPRGAGERVLVVDDEEALVALTKRTLDELGYAATGFVSPTAALDALRADPDAFDAVITDERMPDMSGSRLIREVRAIRRSIPILLVSGYVGGLVVNRAYNSGASEVLKKPLSASELAASLAKVLQAEKSARPA